MYVRYETPHGEGLFRYASWVKYEKRADPRDRKLARLLLEWFDLHLPCPPYEAYRPPDGLLPSTWFKYERREHIDHAFTLALLVSRNLTTVRQRRSEDPGPIVYEDDYQVVVWNPKPETEPEPKALRKTPRRNKRDRTTIRKWRPGTFIVV